jgi:DNA-binding transcriptional ArsR family regulator
MSERERPAEDRETTVEEPPEGRKRVETELLNGTLDLEREATRLKELGEPTRLTLMYLIAEEEQITSGELADLLDRQQNDLYYHLNTLEDAGLIGKHREENTRVYELSPLARTLVTPVFEAIKTRAEAV